MGEETHVVEAVCDHAEALVLHEVEACPGFEVASRQESLQTLPDHP